MDRDEVARAERRRQVREALEFERERAASLHEQVAVIVTDLAGPRIDAEAFATMAPEDVAVVRALLEYGTPGEPEEELPEEAGEWFAVDDEGPADADPEAEEAEIARLEEEIATSRSRQQAFERYLAALGGDA